MDILNSILLVFFTQWSHPDRPPEKVSHSELNDAEITLGVRFPEDYKAEVLSVGLPSPTLALLEAIDSRAVFLHDLSELHTTS